MCWQVIQADSDQLSRVLSVRLLIYYYRTMINGELGWFLVLRHSTSNPKFEYWSLKFLDGKMLITYVINNKPLVTHDIYNKLLVIHTTCIYNKQQ